MFQSSKLRATEDELSSVRFGAAKGIDVAVPMRCAYCQANVRVPGSKLVDGAWQHDCPMRLPGEPDSPSKEFFNEMARMGAS